MTLRHAIALLPLWAVLTAAGLAANAHGWSGGGHSGNQMMFFVIQGDSITACDHVAVQNCYVTYVTQDAAATRGIAVPPSASDGNVGAGFLYPAPGNGQTCTTKGTDWSDAYVNYANARLIIFCGTNDIANGGYTAAQTYGAFTAWLRARIVAGWKVGNIVVVEPLPRANPLSSPAFEAQRQPYNQMLATGATTFGYQLVPLGADTLIGQPGQSSNPTYYVDDNVHPNEAGHAIIAADIVGPTSSCPVCPGVH
jgi:hypothetical protein